MGKSTLLAKIAKDPRGVPTSMGSRSVLNHNINN